MMKKLLIPLFAIMIIGMSPAYAQVTLNHVDLNCEVGGLQAFSAILSSLRICPPFPSNSEAPTFTSITENSVNINWEESGEINVTGYAIRISLDGNNWNFINSNTTPDLFTSYSHSGLNPNTVYFVQWSDIIGGVAISFGPSGTFTTLTSQTPGGQPAPPTPIPDPEIIDPCIEFASDPECLPFEIELTGLTAIDIFLSNVETIAPGETKTAILEIVWEGDATLFIKEVFATDSTGLKFAFTQPIEFFPGTNGKQISKIPYVLEAPLLICTDVQTPKCVYSDSTYAIPVVLIGESNNETIRFTPNLTIHVTEDHEFGTEEIGLGIFGILIVAVIIGKSTSRKDTRARMIRG